MDAIVRRKAACRLTRHCSLRRKATRVLEGSAARALACRAWGRGDACTVLIEEILLPLLLFCSSFPFFPTIAVLPQDCHAQWHTAASAGQCQRGAAPQGPTHRVAQLVQQVAQPLLRQRQVAHGAPLVLWDEDLHTSVMQGSSSMMQGVHTQPCIRERRRLLMLGGLH